MPGKYLVKTVLIVLTAGCLVSCADIFSYRRDLEWDTIEDAIQNKKYEKVNIIVKENQDYGNKLLNEERAKVYDYQRRATKLFHKNSYIKAADLYTRAINAEEGSQKPRKEVLAPLMFKGGEAYEKIGRYPEALKLFKRALKINQQLHHNTLVSNELKSIGQVYNAWGHYDKSIDYYIKALENDRKFASEADIISDYNRIGDVYNSWGKFDKAFEYYNKALEIAYRLYSYVDIAVTLNNIGRYYENQEQYIKASENYEKSFELILNYGKEADIAPYLNNIGTVYLKWGIYDKAEEYYKRALNRARRLSMGVDVSKSLSNLGEVCLARKQYNKSIEFYKKALQIALELERKADIAKFTDQMGRVYYCQKLYPEAIKAYESSVALKEQLRKTATGDIRRDYLASQIETYQVLISSYVKTDNLHKAFHTIELSKAKLLTEQISDSEEVLIPSVKSIQSNLPDNTAILLYANTNQSNIIQMVISNDNITVSELPVDTFMKKIELNVSNGEKDINFETVTRNYHQLIQYPEKRQTYRRLGKLFYDFIFLDDVKNRLKGINKLIIVPDGMLYFLPFESLIDNDEMYLVENYQINYAHSLTVLNLINRRHYSQNRKPLLAFGGAVYDKLRYDCEMITNDAQLAYLKRKTNEKIRNNRSLREIYAQIGKSHWGNLPGTLNEVNEIQHVVSASDIITGKNVSEATLKNMSNRGELRQYKVIHFATHGHVNSQIPELSALVLSQIDYEQNGEDGYLQASEISKLDISSDFVNLSACETGLGKLFKGEGIVGLTQAFLIAGANSLSVSLWQISDESTAIFMPELYKAAMYDDISYSGAISKIKRKFIQGYFGEKWKEPYYWSPFVYYGR